MSKNIYYPLSYVKACGDSINIFLSLVLNAWLKKTGIYLRITNKNFKNREKK